MEEKRPRGHQKGVPNPNGGRKPTGLKRVSFSVSCQPEELTELKKLAKESGKTTSRFLLDLAFNQ
ncbi:MAG: hypothetical protein PUE30_01625 [Spirochaetia bacterium]|nr:hypothetical protein [Spirochaetia bacterium]